MSLDIQRKITFPRIRRGVFFGKHRNRGFFGRILICRSRNLEFIEVIQEYEQWLNGTLDYYMTIPTNTTIDLGD